MSLCVKDAKFFYMKLMNIWWFQQTNLLMCACSTQHMHRQIHMNTSPSEHNLLCFLWGFFSLVISHMNLYNIRISSKIHMYIYFMEIPQEYAGIGKSRRIKLQYLFIICAWVLLLLLFSFFFWNPYINFKNSWCGLLVCCCFSPDEILLKCVERFGTAGFFPTFFCDLSSKVFFSFIPCVKKQYAGVKSVGKKDIPQWNQLQNEMEKFVWCFHDVCLRWKLKKWKEREKKIMNESTNENVYRRPFGRHNILICYQIKRESHLFACLQSIM